MSIELLLYLIDTLSSLSSMCTGLLLLSLVLSILCTARTFVNEISKPKSESECHYVDYIKEKAINLKILKISIPVLIISSILSVVFPSPKTMYAIAFTRYAKQSDIPEKVLKVLEIKLDEIIKGKTK